MTPLETEIDALLTHYYAHFSAMDFAAARSVWDSAEPHPCYLAEEIDDFLRDWPAIEAYWASSQATMSKLQSRHWALRAQQIAADLATATWRLHWNAQIIGQDKPVGGEVRATAVLRRRTEGWRLFHYVEAPLAPILYIRQLYQDQVDPQFRTASPR